MTDSKERLIGKLRYAFTNLGWSEETHEAPEWKEADKILSAHDASISRKARIDELELASANGQILDAYYMNRKYALGGNAGQEKVFGGE